METTPQAIPNIVSIVVPRCAQQGSEDVVDEIAKRHAKGSTKARRNNGGGTCLKWIYTKTDRGWFQGPSLDTVIQQVEGETRSHQLWNCVECGFALLAMTFFPVANPSGGAQATGQTLCWRAGSSWDRLE